MFRPLAPITTKSTTKTGATTETKVMEDDAVDGNHLVVRMANGDLRLSDTAPAGP
jgi:hypothetical protein